MKNFLIFNKVFEMQYTLKDILCITNILNFKLLIMYIFVGVDRLVI